MLPPELEPCPECGGTGEIPIMVEDGTLRYLLERRRRLEAQRQKEAA